MAWISMKMRNGDWVVREDPQSGDELAYWKLGWRESGRERSRKLGYMTEERAVLELKLFEGRRAEEQLIGRNAAHVEHVGRVPTLSAYLDATFLPHRKKTLRPATYDSNWHTAKALRSTMGESRLDAIGGPAIQRHVHTRLAAGLKKRTVNGDLALLRSVLKHAAQGGIIRSVPVVDRLREDAARRPFLEAEDSVLLLKALHQLRGGRRWYAYVCTLMALNTGMRKGELLSRCWDDIHWDHGPYGSIVVRPNAETGFLTKTRQSIRVIPMTPQLRAELATWHEAAGSPESGLLFPQPRKSTRPR